MLNKKPDFNSQNISKRTTKSSQCLNNKENNMLGTVAQACNLSILGGRGGADPEVRSSRSAWPTW